MRRFQECLCLIENVLGIIVCPIHCRISSRRRRRCEFGISRV